MSILITGAAGKLGRLVIKQLLPLVGPGPIVACVRQPESQTALEDLGVTVRMCDYDHPGSLQQAFAGGSTLLLISSPHPDDTVRLRQHAHVIEAAKQAGISQLLYTSFAFPEKSGISLTYLHLATEYAIRTTGIPYTFLRNGLYTDFISALDLNSAIASGHLRVNPGPWAFNSVTRDDLAAAAAAVITGQGHHNKTYELASPNVWTFDELASILSELTGRPVSLDQSAEVSHWIFSFLKRIDTTSTSTDLEKLIGRPVTLLKDSIRSLIEI
ncbi:NmrA family NAD(P)-binding protein [Paenibacillus sp. CN-4]|uniref:NmrA family NAD(P)-binding protein n=1 Tax=Paenibacillus nanchangensis TaxID=3348343 RepID=UPI00397B1C8B